LNSEIADVHFGVLLYALYPRLYEAACSPFASYVCDQDST